MQPTVQAQELVDPAHPLGVALGQVVVDRDQVDALAGQRVEVRGQGADQGLALTGLHLGDVAEVQGGAAHDLHVVVALAEHALGGLADRRERLGEQVVEGLAVGVALLVLVGERPQLGVGEVDEVLFDGVDLVRDAVQLAQDLAFACTHDLVEDGHCRLVSLPVGPGTVVCCAGAACVKGRRPRRNGHRKRGPRRAGRSAATRAACHPHRVNAREVAGGAREVTENRSHPPRGSRAQTPAWSPSPSPPSACCCAPSEPPTRTAVHAACQDPDIQRWTTVPSPYGAQHARGLRRADRARRAGATTPRTTSRWCSPGEDGPLDGRDGPGPAGPAAQPRAPGRAGLLDGQGAPRGAATRREAARAVAHWAFTGLGVERLEWCAEAGNEASRAVALAVGFRMRARPRADRPQGTRRDAWPARCSPPTGAAVDARRTCPARAALPGRRCPPRTGRAAAARRSSDAEPATVRDVPCSGPIVSGRRYRARA